MHNHNDKNNSSMMWMMVLCTLPIVILFFAGGGALRSLPSLAVIGAMVAVHLWMMFRGHGSHGDDQKDYNEHNAVHAGNAEPARGEKKAIPAAIDHNKQ